MLKFNTVHISYLCVCLVPF